MKYVLKLIGAALAVFISLGNIKSAAGADSPAGIDLRGYGTVSADISGKRAVFQCESDEKADMLFGKLLADIFWDAGDRHVEKTAEIKIGPDADAKVTIHLYPPYGALIAARNGREVIVIGGQDERELISNAQSERLLASKGTIFKPSKPYPKYLDFYDLKAVTCYTMGLHPENKYRYLDRSEFVKKFFPGGMFFSTAAFIHSPAQGVFPGYPLIDTDVSLAEKDDQMYSISISTGAWPDWAQAKWPDDIDRQSPISLASQVYLDTVPEALGLSLDQRKETSLELLKDVMLRYKDNPVMGGWQLYCGNYFYETYFSKDIHGHYGYTALGIQAFHHWLRDIRGYGLNELGERWYRDAAHFKAWSDVVLPDPFEFFGNYDSASLPITGHWFWRKAGENESASPAADAPGWSPVQVPPSNMELALPAAPAFWRCSFDASKWLASNAGKDVYLVCNLGDSSYKKYEFWLNGINLGQAKSTITPYVGPVALKVSGALASGTNNLALLSPGGTIVGPVFLTTTRPLPYPYLGKEQNARYVDSLEWRLYELNRKVSDAMAYARSIDPDKPFVICATSDTVKDAQGDALTRFGGSMQDTGYESSWRPFNSRFGYAGGFYGSCEAAGLPPGSALKPDPDVWTKSLGRMLDWVLFNAEGSHIFWRDPYCFFAIEKNTGWFTQNARYIQLVGKYLPEKPGIALLFSSRSALLDPYQGHSLDDWDIGRGELAAAHYDNVMVTDTMLAKGMADDYPVLFDTDTRIMGPEMIAAIRKYVENGGTFVALQGTGRHSILEPDSWPISELTGFKVLSVGETGNIRFESSLPIFKGWEGKEFAGEGSVLDWKDNQSARGVSLGLKPMTGDAVTLAKWGDGTVAVGMRRIGKGKVILLGSTFWRYGRDLGGTGIWKTQDMEIAFFEKLFTGLGVKRTANASDKSVFARKVVTKNGLQDWLVVMDEKDSPASADASFATSKKPAEVWDMNTLTPVAFDYAGGWVTVKDISLKPWEIRIFGVKRASMSEGVDFWWKEKTKFWTRVSAEQPLAEVADNTPSATIQFPTWRFVADKDNSISSGNQWLQPAFDDGSWRNIGNEAWNLKFEDLKNYSGVGLYRSQPFDIPSRWDGRTLTLNADGYVRHLGYCFRSAEFFVNGTKVQDFPAIYRQLDITHELKKRGNVLCIKLTGHNNPSGDFPLSGLLDCTVWIEPEIKLENIMSLAGDWEAATEGWSVSNTVTLPGTATGHHFIKEIDIPSAWQGKSIYLHLRNTVGTRSPAVGMENGLIMINGQPVNIFTYTHKQYALDDTVNLTPYIKFGQKNRIELWPQFTQKDPGKDYQFAIGTVEIGSKME